MALPAEEQRMNWISDTRCTVRHRGDAVQSHRARATRRIRTGCGRVASTVPCHNREHDAMTKAQHRELCNVLVRDVRRLQQQAACMTAGDFCGRTGKAEAIPVAGRELTSPG